MVVKIILLLIYLWDGELTVERKSYSSPEACASAGAARAAEIVSDPKFGGGVFAGCVPSKSTEA